MVLEARNEELDCASLVVPVGAEVFERCTQWCHTDVKKCGDWVLFGDPDAPSTAYLLVHGTPTGKMKIDYEEITTEKWLIKKADDLKAKGIDTVLTIACYGLLHDPIRYHGVLLKSVHDTCFEIYIETLASYPVVVMGKSLSDGPRIVTTPVIRISKRIPTDGKFSRWFKDRFDKFVAYKYTLCPKKTKELK